MILVQKGHRASALQGFQEENTRVVIEGRVLTPPSRIRGIAKSEFLVEKLFKNDRELAIGERVALTIFRNAGDILPGERYRFPARLKPFKNFNNPGRYDYESAMTMKGLSCSASVSDGRYMVPMVGNPVSPEDILEKLRRSIRDFLMEKLSPENYALYRALILGERQSITPELRELFNRTGLGHALAVSGLHIGLVAWLIFTALRMLLSLFYGLALRIDIRKAAALATCVPVVGYTLLTGFQVSSQRAMVMVLAYLFSVILGREKEVWSTLSLAALVVLAIDPHALFSIPFQLSFGAVLGILWLTPGIYEKIRSGIRVENGAGALALRIYDYTAGLVAVTLAATLFLLPVIALYFHRLSPVSLTANITAVPILGLWVLPLGLLGAVSLFACSGLSELLLGCGAWGLDHMTAIIRFWAGLSWSHVWVVTPNYFEILLFYGLLFFIYFIKKTRWARWGLTLFLGLSLLDISYWVAKTTWNRHLNITYLDVGQGSAALVRFPGGKRMLIDGGGFTTDHFDVGRMVVAPFLWSSKISRIHYIVLSHPQSDHMNGLRFIAANFGPKEFWYNGDRVDTPAFLELMQIIDARGIRKVLPEELKGEREISGVKVELLHPAGVRANDGSPGIGLNDNSLVLKFSYNGRSFLFTGDLEARGEAMTVSSAGDRLNSNILLAPHHGSRTSCSPAFLNAVRPEICIISAGSGNFLGFPHRETLDRLYARGCRVVRIDQVGAVDVRVAGDRFSIRTFRDGFR